MNWKECWRKLSRHNLRYELDIFLECLSKTMENLVRIVGVLAKFQTEHLWNTSQKSYCFSQLAQWNHNLMIFGPKHMWYCNPQLEQKTQHCCQCFISTLNIPACGTVLINKTCKVPGQNMTVSQWCFKVDKADITISQWCCKAYIAEHLYDWSLNCN
jgi:hypothetical protein